jgi:hypothetical protein
MPMTESKTRTALGLFLVISHFAVLLLIITLHFLGGFKFDEMTTAVAIITPMFASFTTVIVSQVITERSQVAAASENVSAPFVFLSFFFPVLFVGYLVAVILLRAFNLAIENFEHFKGLLALGETAFAVYIGQFIKGLFKQATQ